MTIDSLYQRWYDTNASTPFYSDRLDSLSFDHFRDAWMCDADSLIEAGISPLSLTAADIDSDDEFDTDIYTSDEVVFIFNYFLS